MLCLYFDLNYPRSREIVKKQGNYQKLLAMYLKNPRSEAILQQVRQNVLQSPVT